MSSSQNQKTRGFHPYNPNRTENSNRPSFYQSSSRDNWRHQNNSPQARKFEIDAEKKIAKFFIHPHSLHRNEYAQLGEPVEIGSVLTPKRKLEIEQKTGDKVLADKSEKGPPIGVRYLVLPKDGANCHFDLTLGASQFVDHVPHQNGLDPLLTWIIENKENLKNESANKAKKPLVVDFVQWRGLLTNLMTSPYEKENDFMFSIVLYRGTYYLCEIETEKNKVERLNRDEVRKNFMYWGFKFEEYVTSDVANEEPNGADKVPDPENNYSTIVRTNLSEHRLFYGAEVDCCVSETHESLRNYCEIKTSRGESAKDLKFDRNPKFFKWYLQSRLVGNENYCVGLRDDKGFINKIVSCKNSEIYESSKKRYDYEMCSNFVKCFFDLIKNFCVEEDELFIVERGANSDAITINKVERNSELFREKYFLRDWYKKEVDNL